MAFTRLQSVIPQVAAKYGIAGEIQAARLCHVFLETVREMFGDDVAGRIGSHYVKNHILWISLPSSSIAQALQLKKHLILEKLQHDVPEMKVKDIRIR